MRDVVAVGVVPRPRRGVDRRIHGTVRAGDAGCRLPGHIPAQEHLERGLAVAKQVVGGAQPRGEIPPGRHVIYPLEIARGHPSPRRQVQFGDVRVEVIEPHAKIERHFSDGPLILSVESELSLLHLIDVGRREVCDRLGHRVPKRVAQIVVDKSLAHPPRLHQGEPSLESMRTRDIGHSQPLVELAELLGSPGHGGSKTRASGAVPVIPRELQDRVVVIGPARQKVANSPNHRRPTSLEQEAVGGRQVPAGLQPVVGLIQVSPGCFRRSERILYGPEAVAVAFSNVSEVQLVPLRHLPRRAQAGLPVVVLCVGRPAEIGLVEQGALELVEIIPRQIRASGEPPLAKREPQLIFLDWAPNSPAEVIQRFDLGLRAHATCAQLVRHVRILQLRVAEAGL